MLTLGCAGLLACTTAKLPAAESSAQAGADKKSAQSASAEEPAHTRFLLESEAGQLVLRSTRSGAEQVLAGAAQRGLYDERLELVWYEEGERLWVRDLRKLQAGPVLIAEHLPEHAEFHVARTADLMLEPADGCDSMPVLLLNWSEKSVFEAFYTDVPTLAAEGTAWLAAELKRPARTLPKARAFSEDQREPAWNGARAQCEEPFVCGSSLAFGASTKQLVLTSAQSGDCWHFACVLRDPQTGTFGTAPDATSWGAASAAEPGSCGPYRFNRDGSAFLVDERLCLAGGSCQALGGRALGWLEPGVTLGAP